MKKVQGTFSVYRKMIQIKQLSGDYITIETREWLDGVDVAMLGELMPSPFPVFFRGDRQLGSDEVVFPNETELCVVFQSYRTYFVWSGGNNSVWPGDMDKIYCIDCSAREMIEWDSSILSDNDIVVVDYLSFGLYHPYNDQIMPMLGITFIPIDMDRAELFEVLDQWKDRAEREGDEEKLSYQEFLFKYMDVDSGLRYKWHTKTVVTKRMKLFRATDNYCRTALEWLKRVTE